MTLKSELKKASFLVYHPDGFGETAMTFSEKIKVIPLSALKKIYFDALKKQIVISPADMMQAISEIETEGLSIVNFPDGVKKILAAEK